MMLLQHLGPVSSSPINCTQDCCPRGFRHPQLFPFRRQFTTSKICVHEGDISGSCLLLIFLLCACFSFCTDQEYLRSSLIGYSCASDEKHLTLTTLCRSGCCRSTIERAAGPDGTGHLTHFDSTWQNLTCSFKGYR